MMPRTLGITMFAVVHFVLLIFQFDLRGMYLFDDTKAGRMSSHLSKGRLMIWVESPYRTSN